MSSEDSDSDSTLSDTGQGRKSAMSSCPDLVNCNEFSDSNDELSQDSLHLSETVVAKHAVLHNRDKSCEKLATTEAEVFNQNIELNYTVTGEKKHTQRDTNGDIKDTLTKRKNHFNPFENDSLGDVDMEKREELSDKHYLSAKHSNTGGFNMDEDHLMDSDIDSIDSIDYLDACIEFDYTSEDDWSDSEGDYVCPHVFNWKLPGDLDGVDKNMTRKNKNPTDMDKMDKIIAALMAKTEHYPRIFHTKTNPGREKSDDSGLGMTGMKTIYASSPLHMLATMAKMYNRDITELMDSSESMNKTLSFPCMQCYEKLGTSGQRYGKSMRGAFGSSMEGGYGGVVNGRCTSCGGSVMTISTFCKAIKKMREKLKAEKLFICDTYPDGNCLFGSIVDQLYIRGDFRYTISKLREAAVTYLRENPVAEDGTHYEMFLTEETWNAYLSRMSLDGEWGDHMVLSAIASLLTCRIVILSGTEGAGETIIFPREHNQDQVSSLDTIYLGHLGESHYLSLRPQNWREELTKKINNLSDVSNDRTRHADPLNKMSERLLPLHTDTIVKTLFLLDFVTSLRKDVIDVVTPGRHEDDKFVYEMMGDLINKAEPCMCKVESIGPPLESYFPGLSDKVTDTDTKLATITLYCTPKDSKVMFNPNKASCLDLVCKNTDSVGIVKLSPVDPKVWGTAVDQGDDGSYWLKTFTVDVNADDLFPILHDFPDLQINAVIGFSCRWPDEAFGWIARQRNSHLLSEDLIEEIVVGGCHVVPISSYDTKAVGSVNENDEGNTIIQKRTWTLSFAAAEKRIFQDLSQFQQNCYLLLQLFVKHLSSESKPFESLIKNLFFYACEEMDATVWEKHPGVCILNLLQNLAQGLKEGTIPHFFTSGKNLLKSIPKKDVDHIYMKVNSFCKHPFIGIYFFLDHFNITTTELAPLLDDIMGDICSDRTNSNDFFHRVILPSLSSMLRALVQKQEYRDAMILAEYIRADIKHFVDIDVPMKVIVNKCMFSFYIGLRWCFALYMDISNKTKLTKEIIENDETVSITQIFGPRCIEDLPDTVTSVMYSIAYGDLNFPYYVQAILSQLGKTRAITTCIRYYVDTLNQIAGDELVVGLTCKRGQIGLLYELYLSLYQAYKDLNKVQEFRSLMPTMTKIVESLGHPTYDKKLRLIWRSLGDNAKADENTSFSRSRGTESFNLFMDMMAGRMGEDVSETPCPCQTS